MTVEEIEILVTAKVEEALKQFMQIAPAIKKEIKKAQEAFSNIDMKKLNKKVEQSMILVKKHINNIKKAGQNVKINLKVNKEEVQKQVSQTKKAIDSLSKQTTSRKWC